MSLHQLPPVFPYEILALIVLESVDVPSTLASWSSTSRAMFELASPLVYERVVLTRDDQWEAWFLDAVSETTCPTSSVGDSRERDRRKRW